MRISVWHKSMLQNMGCVSQAAVQWFDHKIGMSKAIVDHVWFNEWSNGLVLYIVARKCVLRTEFGLDYLRKTWHWVNNMQWQAFFLSTCCSLYGRVQQIDRILFYRKAIWHRRSISPIKVIGLSVGLRLIKLSSSVPEKNTHQIKCRE